MLKEKVLNKRLKAHNDEFLKDLLKGFIYNKGDNDDRRQELGDEEEDDDDKWKELGDDEDDDLEEYELEEEDNDD